MSIYDFLQNVIRVLPILLLVGLFVGLHRKKWYWRSFAVVMVGWVVIAVSTNVYWWYALEFAPSEEVQEYVAAKDGAPRLFGTLFGWFFALIFLLMAEIVRFIALFLVSFFKASR